MDRRKIKTEKAIINAFLALRAKQSLEAITVKELAAEAMINKSTFYMYYEDINALSAKLERDIVASIIASIPHPEDIIDDNEKFSRDFFYAIIGNRQMIDIIFSGSRYGCLIQEIESAIKELVMKAHPAYRQNPLSPLLIDYTIYGGFYAFEKNKTGDPARQDFLISALSSFSKTLLDYTKKHAST